MTSKLFTPLKIGKMEITNRFMRSATWDAMAEESGEVSERSRALYHELNTGGIGLIITGFAFVSHPLGQAGGGQYGIYNDKMIAGWQPIIKEAHNHGSKIAMQIVHAGINSGYLSQRGITLQAVSEMPEIARRLHKEMMEAEIEQIIADFVAAGVRVKEAGFDAVQLHGAHGYLISQFASPLYNRRIDKWGGSPENRRRFVLEIISRLRKAVGPDFPILIKFGVQDDKTEGLSFAEGLETCRQMEKAGLNSIEVSAGVGIAISKPKDGEVLQPLFRERAAAVKKAGKIPVAVVNGIRAMKTAEDIIDNGDADMVSLSRPFVREPHLLLRWQKGDIAPATCISCSKCMSTAVKDAALECAEDRRIKDEASIRS
jgi:2,4-dienoyl-CoA reductase-like NADH-dependent reductase (Old Yellow Enzyme family)